MEADLQKDHVIRLRQRIAEVFPKHGPPSKLGASLESEPRAQKLLRSRKWDDLEWKQIAEIGDRWLLLRPEVFRYFLPAFLLASLDELERAGNAGLAQLVVFALTPDDRTRLRFDTRFSPLTPEQRQVIRSFLQVMADHGSWLVLEGAEEALQAYWREA
jgi:hypothetical protein